MTSKRKQLLLATTLGLSLALPSQSIAGDPLKEIFGMMLLTRHNLHYYQELMAGMRAAIEAGTFAGFQSDFTARYTGGDIETE